MARTCFLSDIAYRQASAASLSHPLANTLAQRQKLHASSSHDATPAQQTCHCAQNSVLRTTIWSGSQEIQVRSTACGASGSSGAEAVERRTAEDDVHYRRVDDSEVHAHAARQAFARNIACGEAGLDIAAAALQVAAEDDALVSHSTVQFPVRQYLDRIQRLATDLARQRLVGLPPESSDPEAVVQVVERYLFEEQGILPTPYGRSNLPPGAGSVDHPGVWEDARHAYLHEALITRIGTPALLAVLLSDVMRRLLALGAVDFAVRMDYGDFDRLPRAIPLPGMTRASLLREDGSVVNTCSSAALVELLRFLKRAYWPFAWAPDSSGGFEGAAVVALEGEADASMQAIARTAKHRLERGIWTSPGAGDLRRALAASERLVMLAAAEEPRERRDLAVLLLHAGQFQQAAVELQVYKGSTAFKEAGQTERSLMDRLLELLGRAPPPAGPQPCPLSIKSVLDRPVPVPDPERRIPLTW